MSLASLHEPYDTLLRFALDQATPPGARLALDVGCGPGLKTPWLAARLAPGGHILGIDLDRHALRPTLTAPGLPTDSATSFGTRHSALGTRHSALICADALALPVRGGCADLAWCVAALHLFADEERALCELRQALRPGGAAVVAVAEQRWVRVRHDQGARCTVRPTLPAGLIPADGLGDDLIAQLAAAGFQAPTVAAYLLDPTLEPRAAALALAAPNPPDRAGVSTAPDGGSDPEIAPVLLVAVGHA